MQKHLLQTAEFLHKGTVLVCMVLFGVMALSTIATVIGRYAFQVGFLWLQDAGVFAFGLLAILSLPVALFHNRHVRVDIARQNQSALVRARVDWVAYLTMLVPIFLLLLVYSMPDVIASISLREGSQQIGGLPGYYLVKAGLPVACVLMFVQGFALLIRPSQAQDGR